MLLLKTKGRVDAGTFDVAQMTSEGVPMVQGHGCRGHGAKGRRGGRRRRRGVVIGGRRSVGVVGSEGRGGLVPCVGVGG